MQVCISFFLLVCKVFCFSSVMLLKECAAVDVQDQITNTKRSGDRYKRILDSFSGEW